MTASAVNGRYALVLSPEELRWLSDWLKAGTAAVEPEGARVELKVDDLMAAIASYGRPH